MSVSWAKELGIDIRELREESFSHPRRVGEHRKLVEKAQAYWATREATNSRQVSPHTAMLDHDVQSNL